jgi:anti-sigma factor RsiW
MNGARPIAEDDLQAFVDQALEPKRRSEVEAYLDGHPEAAARIRALVQQREALRAALAPVADEPLPPELNLARLIEMRRRPFLPSLRIAAVAALCLVLGGGAGWFMHGSLVRPESGMALLAREAADNYAVYGADRRHPVEIRAENSAELLGWISQRLGHAVAVPDLAASGYRFMGGRVVATPQGPAGLLMYDDDHGTRLVMLMRPMASQQDTPMSRQDHGPVTGFAWADGGIGYSLVGQAAPETLHPLADEVRRQIGKRI